MTPSIELPISDYDHVLFFFFFNAPAPTEFYTLPLPDALPISWGRAGPGPLPAGPVAGGLLPDRRRRARLREPGVPDGHRGVPGRRSRSHVGLPRRSAAARP